MVWLQNTVVLMTAALEQQFQAVHVGRCQITHQCVKDVNFVSYGYQNLFVDMLLMDG